MTDQSDPDARRPPSVRDSMGPAGDQLPPAREGMDNVRDPAELAEAAVERMIGEGEDRWVVRVEGRATARAGSSTGTPLLLLTFAPEASPEERVYEAVVVGRRLDRLPESELVAARASSVRFRKDWDPKDLFQETRRSKGGG